MFDGCPAGGPPIPVEAKAEKSFIVGGIAPCTGLPSGQFKNPKLPRWAAGTVFVFQGPMRRTREGGLSLPQHMVAKQTVRVNATYRIAVFPGHYLLVARLPHSNVQPFVRVRVRWGGRSHQYSRPV